MGQTNAKITTELPLLVYKILLEPQDELNELLKGEQSVITF